MNKSKPTTHVMITDFKLRLEYTKWIIKFVDKYNWLTHTNIIAWYCLIILLSLQNYVTLMMKNE